MSAHQLSTVSLEDECTAIAGILKHGTVPSGLSPKCLPTPTARALLEACLEIRIGARRDFGATVRHMADVVERQGLADGSSILETVVAFADLEAPMLPNDLERNARHLARAAESRRLAGELERARERNEHRLEAVLADKLADLQSGEESREAIVCVSAAELEEKPLEWLWPGWIPLGMLTLLSSPPKCGKSMLTARIAAIVSTGARWPSGPKLPGQAEEDAALGNVLMIAYEDDHERTVLPRLNAAGADLSRVRFLKGIKRPRGPRTAIQPILLAEHFHAIEDTVQTERISLVIVDPVMSGFGGERDTNADNEVRAVLGPFVAFAEETRCTFVFVTHTNKRNAGPALDSAIGSRAFTGLCRSVIGLARLKEPKNRRLLAPIAMNLGKPRPSLVFDIGSAEGQESRSVVEFVEEFDGDMDDFVRQEAERLSAQKAERKRQHANGQLEKCKSAMHGIVEREKWIESKDLDLELESAGYSNRTIDRARHSLKTNGNLENSRRCDIWWTHLPGCTEGGTRFPRAAQAHLEEKRRAQGGN